MIPPVEGCESLKVGIADEIVTVFTCDYHFTPGEVKEIIDLFLQTA